MAARKAAWRQREGVAAWRQRKKLAAWKQGVAAWWQVEGASCKVARGSRLAAKRVSNQ